MADIRTVTVPSPEALDLAAEVIEIRSKAIDIDGNQPVRPSTLRAAAEEGRILRRAAGKENDGVHVRLDPPETFRVEHNVVKELPNVDTEDTTQLRWVAKFLERLDQPIASEAHMVIQSLVRRASVIEKANADGHWHEQLLAVACTLWKRRGNKGDPWMTWDELTPEVRDTYLDEARALQAGGFLREDDPDESDDEVETEDDRCPNTFHRRGNPERTTQCLSDRGHSGTCNYDYESLDA